MWADAQAVSLAYARAVASSPWLVQSKLPSDWVTRTATGLFVVKVGTSPSPLDSRFDYLTHAIDVNVYVSGDLDREDALVKVHAFKEALVAGAATPKGRTASPPEIVTAPFEFPAENVPAGVTRVTAAFRATFSA